MFTEGTCRVTSRLQGRLVAVDRWYNANAPPMSTHPAKATVMAVFIDEAGNHQRQAQNHAIKTGPAIQVEARFRSRISGF